MIKVFWKTSDLMIFLRDIWRGTQNQNTQIYSNFHNFSVLRIFHFFVFFNLVFQVFQHFFVIIQVFPDIGARRPPYGCDNNLMRFIGHYYHCYHFFNLTNFSNFLIKIAFFPFFQIFGHFSNHSCLKNRVTSPSV